MDEYLELGKVLDDKNIITVQTKEYGSIDVIPVDTITDIELSDVQPVNQWISIKDRLPDEDDCYLVVIESEICVSIDIAEYSKNRWHKHDKVLYWQPLPELPKDGDSKC